MKSKNVTRALVALIFLCLAILVMRGLRNGEPEPSTQAAAQEPAGPAEAAQATRGAYTTPSGAPLPPLTREDIHIFIEGLLKPELPPEVRAWTAWQLARATLENEAVDAALRSILEDPEPEVAAAAAAALSKRGEPGVAAPATEARNRTPADAGDAVPPGMRIETLD